MTKKHFEAIAEVFFENRPERFGQSKDRQDEHKRLAEDMAVRFKIFNPQFNRHRFLSACGVV